MSSAVMSAGSFLVMSRSAAVLARTAMGVSLLLVWINILAETFACVSFCAVLHEVQIPMESFLGSTVFLQFMQEKFLSSACIHLSQLPP